ncbi:MAG: Holliday junction resolvase-like protein [Candidatus Absconditabacteria bacterium]|nr:Holliday junction resolvase-like protein [Candidatus Absconditabacteria bacterium]MDD3868158.1 Holliday junction resolvase-like protein [Candidatus Absconditabacteria bacterium]MDD4714544.1 Holliday junction resolvase-like protein [Candidatus Absconditabacteria bacterium]
MEQQLFPLIIGIAIGAVVGYLFAKIALHSHIKDARRHATKQSRSVLLGDVNEKLAPALPGFPYHFKDMVFIGKGIDYLVFDGLAEGNLRQIVLLEIKSGSSQLNRNERSIQSVLSRGNISYEVFRVTM